MIFSTVLTTYFLLGGSADTISNWDSDGQYTVEDLLFSAFGENEVAVVPSGSTICGPCQIIFDIHSQKLGACHWIQTVSMDLIAMS